MATDRQLRTALECPAFDYPAFDGGSCAAHRAPAQELRAPRAKPPNDGERPIRSSHPGQPGEDEQMRVHRTGTHVVVELSGEVDIATAVRVDPLLDAVTAEPRLRLAVDLNPVDFFDGSGVRLLSRARSRVLEHGGELTVVCDRPLVLRVLRAAGVFEAFAPVPCLTAATGP